MPSLMIYENRLILCTLNIKVMQKTHVISIRYKERTMYSWGHRTIVLLSFYLTFKYYYFKPNIKI